MKHRSVAWHRRLSLRLALLVALVIGLFNLSVDPLHDLATKLWGFPSSTDGVWILGSPELGEQLLTGAEREGDGFWRPTDVARSGIDDLFVHGETYAWFSRAGEPIVASFAAPWDPSEPWTAPVEGATLLEDPDGEERWIIIPSVIHVEEEEAGILVFFLPVFHEDEADPRMYFASEDEFFAAHDQIDKFLTAVVVTIPSLLLGFLVSAIVTHRLSRLSQAASTPLESGETPPPFPDLGQDEVGQLASALNAMRARTIELFEDLKQQDASRRTWIAQVSHDLRTPLTALNACLHRARERVLDRPGGTNRDELEKLLAGATWDVQRLQALAEDLLDVARLDAAEEMHLEPVPPAELVRSAIQGLQALAAARGKRIETDLLSGAGILEADGPRLLRALENLIRNAIEHADSQITVRLLRSGAELRFVVEDDGPGLPHTNGAIDLHSLGSRGRAADSAGLGLLVTARIAELHGGRMGADNPPSGGASVWFSLPSVSE